jgi:RimJ/RimL family protein N-acetyltransferase
MIARVSDAEESLRQARPSDARDYAAHIVRHLADSGKDGDLHYAPISSIDRDDVAHACERRWSAQIGEPGWGRAWVLVRKVSFGFLPGPSSNVVGHVELRGPTLSAALHRADLSLGLERAWRAKGYGRMLVALALDWARHETALRFIDLKVFAHNTPARALYGRFGFREMGHVDEAFVMPDGTVLDDILMVLPLSRNAPPG